MPQVFPYQNVSTNQSITQITFIKSSMLYIQIPFQGKTLQGQLHSQFVQGWPFQTGFLQGQALQSQPFQGQFLQGQMGQGPLFQNQPYLDHTFQVAIQLKFAMAHHGYLGGIKIPTAQAIPGYPGYPPPGTGLVLQGYQYAQHDPNHQLPFIATLDLPDLSQLTNDPIYYLPYWLVIPTKFPSDICNFEGKSREDPSNHVMTYHLWCVSNSLIYDSIRL